MQFSHDNRNGKSLSTIFNHSVGLGWEKVNLQSIMVLGWPSHKLLSLVPASKAFFSPFQAGGVSDKSTPYDFDHGTRVETWRRYLPAIKHDAGNHCNSGKTMHEGDMFSQPATASYSQLQPASVDIAADVQIFPAKTWICWRWFLFSPWEIHFLGNL